MMEHPAPTFQVDLLRPYPRKLLVMGHLVPPCTSIAPFEAPKHVFFVGGLPRNASGKILKRQLHARFANEVEGSAANRDTARTVEEAL